MKVFMKNFYLFLFGKILFAPLVPKRACFGLVVLPNLGPIALGAAPNLPPGVVDGDFVFTKVPAAAFISLVKPLFNLCFTSFDVPWLLGPLRNEPCLAMILSSLYLAN
jgi:hypothetical protein